MKTRRIVVIVTTAVVVLALGPGCSVQSFVAKMALKHVAKKVYHRVKDSHEKQKSAKAREKSREETRQAPRYRQEQSKRTQGDTPTEHETQE